MKKNNLENIRHSLAHLLAAAVLERFPGAKFGIGPVIENGFYYDFSLPRNLTPNDLKDFEGSMRKFIKDGLTFSGKKVAPAEARRIFKDQQFKLELIKDFAHPPKGVKKQPLTVYKTGKIFLDLCRGGHVRNTKEINADAFKLVKIAGAYWKGDEKKPQLQRVYGLAFNNKKELNEYLKMMEEAEKRDHRLLGQKLDLFSQHEVSPGAIFWHPKGMVIWKELENFIRQKNEALNYGEVSTPVMVKKGLYEKSGHWQYYKENGFWFDVDNETYVLKPMNCPEGTLIYSNVKRSYRDLPIKLAEPTGRLHRNELRGVLGGLFRVRQFTQDDAHVFCRPDQIEQEIFSLISYAKELYKIVNMPISFKLATKPDKAMGNPKLWTKAEQALKDVLKKLKIPYELKPKDGAFYGPKIDIHAKDAIGREHQLSTIQLDFQMPERFKLEYTDEKGKPQRPIMIHRAILGSFERFIGVLIEHFAGDFPTWLSPVQVKILAVSDKQDAYAKDVFELLKNRGIRVELAPSNETLGKRIREAELEKVPYVLVVGDKEKSANTVSIRKRHIKDMIVESVPEFLDQIKKEINEKTA
ncbi:MAG: threonine--tRNA ligase [Patescibacteria group bacterium]